MNETAVYLRISLDQTGDHLGVDRQRDECMSLLAERGWTLYEEYVDNSISASKEDVMRPAYERMKDDYQAGRFKKIVCYDLDRLTRQITQLEWWIKQAEHHGLQLVTANGDADLGTDGGRLFARIKASVARAEVERKSARQRSAHAQRVRQGRPTSGGVRPFGYNQDGTLNEGEADVVRAIYDAVLNDWSLHDIARALNGEETVAGKRLPVIPKTPPHMVTVQHERNARRVAEGREPKPVRDDYVWRYTTLHDILRNPRHAGYSYINTSSNERGRRRELIRDDSGEIVRGQWEPTVGPAVWEAVQQIITDEKRRSNSGRVERVHMGSGLYRCGECGGTMQTHTKYYRCPRCRFGRSHEMIDAYVEAVVVAALNQPHIAAELRQSQEGEQAAVFTEQIAAQRARIDRAQEDYDNGDIEARDLKRVRGKAEAEIERLEVARAKTISSRDTLAVFEADRPGDAFSRGDQMTKRAIIKTLATVTLHRGTQGKKGLDPSTVSIEWVTEAE